jgi:superfamily II DNA or RNA helicase
MTGLVSVSFAHGTLRVHGLTAAMAAALPGGLTWDGRVGAWVTHALHHHALMVALKDAGLAAEDHLEPPRALVLGPVALPTLRTEQRDALAAWRRADHRGVMVMPTGTGKTVVALHAMASLGVATLVVAPVRDLMHQWHARIKDVLGQDAGIVGDQHHTVRPITVTTYDSAYLHMDKLGAQFGLIIFDEAHHLPARSTREAALMCAAPARLGLTATPERADGAHVDLDTLVGPTVYTLKLARVAGRSLADYHVERIPVSLTPEEQTRYDRACAEVRAYVTARRKDVPGYAFLDVAKEAASDVDARRAQKAYFRKCRMEDRAEEKLRVLEDLFQRHPGERIIIFTGSNAMAMDVSRRFLVPTLLAFSRKNERREVLAAFSRGDLPVLVANQVLDEGVDVPEAKVAIVIGGQASTRQAKQRLGRILRRSGGQRATLYEVVVRDTAEEKRSRARRRSDAFHREADGP